jgi:hypothetical protein
MPAKREEVATNLHDAKVSVAFLISTPKLTSAAPDVAILIYVAAAKAEVARSNPLCAHCCSQSRDRTLKFTPLLDAHRRRLQRARAEPELPKRIDARAAVPAWARS